MRKPNSPAHVFENIEITDISTEGKGIGRVPGGDKSIVCFIDFAIPGDVVDIQITKKKSNLREGKVLAYKKFSDKRTEPVCKHFGTCGGCKWQNMKYEAQLEFKQKYVWDALTRIGNIPLSLEKGTKGELMPIIPSKKYFHYRNKLEFTFSNKRWLTNEDFKTLNIGEDMGSAAYGLGFHIPKLFDKVLDIEECHLQEDPSNAIRMEVRKFSIENNLTFFDIRRQNGFLRNLIIRSTSTGQWMAVVVFFYEDKPARESLLKHIAEKFPQITSLQYVINSKKNDSIFDQEVKTFSGADSIYETMEGLKFRISPKSFFQTNSLQAYELYKATSDFAELKGDEIVYDLYTGTGTIANFVAGRAKEVIGIEYIPVAIEDAKVNSQINNISNTSFFSGDIKEVLSNGFIADHGKPDVIITDPPRAGMQEDVVRKILEINPEKIIYVSCNPATQARDIALMNERYFTEKVQPIDMFPHTAHVESVAKLVRK
ncbi:MAG: 23S rRNA (uracil(1939)-C(5))-methyltransferase RlmD [Bacteroidetes bacterium]|nr:MAG: 23S rRNA (uracil(1939)-C(5))-methyltransferase RlmD [Bacteroidota bacterium]